MAKTKLKSAKVHKVSERALEERKAKEEKKTLEEKQKAMMRNVVQIAKDFKIRTVAEGVETEENEHFLQEINCDYGQGYYYSRPIPAAEFEERFLKEKGA